MGKTYTVQLNSVNATTITTAYSNVTYNICWADLLPQNKKFKVTFAFMGQLNYGNNSTFPTIITNLLAHTYKPAINGFQNSYYLGHLHPISVIMKPVSLPITSYSNYNATTIDNPPIYLENRPMNNNLQVQILNGEGTSEFQDNFLSAASSGTRTLTQIDNLITIINPGSTGVITIGTVITPTGLPARTILEFVNGTGGQGTYLCNLSSTITPVTTFTYGEDTTRSNIAPYVMNLYFEELDD